MLARLLFAVVLLVQCACAISLTGPRLLVVQDPSFIKEDHSVFFDDLTERKFDIDFRAPNDPDLGLFAYGERTYDHVILTLPKTQKALGPNLLAKPLLEFLTKGGNVIVLLNPSERPLGAVRELGSQLDFTLPMRDSYLVDHFNYDPDTSSEQHTSILLDPATAIDCPDIISVSDTSKKIKYPLGSGMYLGNSPLILPILHAHETAYVYNTGEEDTASATPFSTGTQTYLVAGFQALNNARLVFVTSSAMLSDVAFDDSANREFAAAVSKWAFQERGVIKLTSVSHSLVNSAEISPSIYRVKQDIAYSAALSEYVDDHWVPYVASDVQLEFTMLDPYYRITLTPSGAVDSSEIFSTIFKAPDQHGVFSFVLNYKRPGLSYIKDKRAVTLRHFGHNEFLRSFAIPNAWPYITSIVTVIGAWALFIVLWLFSGPGSSPKKTQ
ncbi:Dolichyl-diphosphooligosaccharide--protein glycosyltransferase subunit WBP1 [Limtongia smithiae]|uniref:Dolichyl-diphosphooligosaccharide--protein glycosyltransferase subunit WBP1 n=1 Tax=Limtongia smithiae TaxID=1125753 RepID=UPI0034CFCB91